MLYAALESALRVKREPSLVCVQYGNVTIQFSLSGSAFGLCILICVFCVGAVFIHKK